MVYGANGYTGRLIVEEAVRRGLRPVVAGRNANAIEALALEYGLDSRVFELDPPGRAKAGVDGMSAVLHCAGPFARTSSRMVDACLETRAAYLDITGEIEVFEKIMSKDREAKLQGVALIPGVGFDVVPTDALAARLAKELPDAVELDLAFYSRRGGLSRGTLRTMIEGLGRPGAIRLEGSIVPVTTAFHVREIPFSCGSRTAMTIPWGDVSTAYHSTGIPNVRVYVAATPDSIARLRLLSRARLVLGLKPIRRALQMLVSEGGPDPRVRQVARTFLWGEVRNEKGESVSITGEGPEGYTLTAITAVSAVERVLAGAVPGGSWTPSKAFGIAFSESIPGLEYHAPVRSRDT